MARASCTILLFRIKMVLFWWELTSIWVMICLTCLHDLWTSQWASSSDLTDYIGKLLIMTIDKISWKGRVGAGFSSNQWSTQGLGPSWNRIDIHVYILNSALVGSMSICRGCPSITLLDLYTRVYIMHSECTEQFTPSNSPHYHLQFQRDMVITISY